MEFTQGNIYHIYNRGNDRKPIFFEPENYLFFLRKVKLNIFPYCDIFSYTLMPNHFHFLIHANELTVEPIKRGMIITNPLSEGIRLLLSSYSQAVNKQQFKTGSLFQQNTRSRCVTLKHSDYSCPCFHYIHQNALKAGLVEKIEDWPYSSFNEYLSPLNDNFCNKALACELLDIDMERFYNDSYGIIRDDILKVIC